MTFSVNATNDFLTGRTPTVTPSDSSDNTVRFRLPLQTADLALNTIGNIAILPAGCVPVSILFDSDDLDSNATPTIAWSVGVSNASVVNNIQGVTPTALSTASVDGGAAWATSILTSRNSGQDMLTSRALSRVAPTTYDRYVVLQATTAAATAVAGEVGLTLTYRFA